MAFLLFSLFYFNIFCSWLYFNIIFAQNNIINNLGGVILKGKIIDYSSFEAFIALADDTIIRVPLSQVSNPGCIGSTIDISSSSGSFGYCNNHTKPSIYQDKLIDFF